MDTDGFDIVETIGGAYNSGTVSNSKNDWMFMNVYGVHPSIPGASGLDFANLAAANAALSSQSILDNLQSVSKGFEDFAQSFCVVVRGTAAKRADNVEFLEAAEDKGIGTRLLDYGPGSLTDGVFTYDHEGIQDVLGATDISNDNQDLLDLGLNNVSTEISGYLRSVFRPAPAGSSPSTLRNMGGINGLSLADYHEHSQKIRFRNPASGTSITGLASGGTKISEFIGVVGALLPDTIDQNITAAESLGMDFPLNLIG